MPPRLMAWFGDNELNSALKSFICGVEGGSGVEDKDTEFNKPANAVNKSLITVKSMRLGFKGFCLVLKPFNANLMQHNFKSRISKKIQMMMMTDDTK